MIWLQTPGNITLNGQINVDAASGGGAGNFLFFFFFFNLAFLGGSVYIQGDTFNGTGIISANGGAQASTGGGGGGRIYITSTRNLFNGTIRAYGGSGSYPGGAGTIVIASTSMYEIPK